MSECILCRSTEKNEINFGPMYEEGGIIVHHNCLYLSSDLPQRGHDGSGIVQFLEDDIIAESARTQPMLCTYCGKPGANIGCCHKSCHKTFHTGCGQKNGALNQYVHTFKSFCNRHVPEHKYRPAENEICIICCEDLMQEGEAFNMTTMLFSPCCHNGWYHKICLQKYANSSGFFFKCPLCNNGDVIRSVSNWGIFIQDRDASWEGDPDAFYDLRREVQCTAAICINSAGRRGTESDFYYCRFCGSSPVHPACSGVSEYRYICFSCTICKTELDSDATTPLRVWSPQSIVSPKSDSTESEMSTPTSPRSVLESSPQTSQSTGCQLQSPQTSNSSNASTQGDMIGDMTVSEFNRFFALMPETVILTTSDSDSEDNGLYFDPNCVDPIELSSDDDSLDCLDKENVENGAVSTVSTDNKSSPMAGSPATPKWSVWSVNLLSEEEKSPSVAQNYQPLGTNIENTGSQREPFGTNRGRARTTMSNLEVPQVNERVLRNRRITIGPLLGQDESATRSRSRSRSAYQTDSIDNVDWNVSCVANRTRRRWPIYKELHNSPKPDSKNK